MKKKRFLEIRCARVQRNSVSLVEYAKVCCSLVERKNIEWKNIERKNVENVEKRNVERKISKGKISKRKISKWKNVENFN